MPNLTVVRKILMKKIPFFFNPINNKIKIWNHAFNGLLYCMFIENELSRFSSSAGTEGDDETASSPYFDLDNSGNVTAVLGKTAYLNCRVKNIKNQTVRINS